MKDSDDRILEKDLLARAFAARYNGCLLIDAVSGAVRSVSDTLAGDLLPLGRFDGTPYDRQIRALTRRLVPRPERPSLSDRLMLSVVREKLDADGRYRVDFHSLGRDGTTVFHRVAYEYLDDRRDTIVLLCEDVTDLVTGETDPLTGGYNARGFYRQINRYLAANPGRRYRVHHYSIDQFRDITGVYGQELGDRLLRDIAAYMRRYDGPDSFSAHLNADHFVRFCAEECMSVTDCYAHFVECFSGYRRLNIPLTLHIGVYDLCEEGIEPRMMDYKAFLAMQSIKGNMRKDIAYYEIGMLRHEQEQMELLNDIDRAIREEEFEVWFQPQVKYDEHSVFSAEALVRWRHPRRGLLPPGEFIPLLEKSNYITKVDRYIIEKTCRYMRAWMDMAPAQTVQISVNLSREDVLDAALLPFLLDTVRRYAILPAALHLEITESAYIEDAERLIEAVAHLREAGFPVELDDFGAGYSSLNTLKDIAVDKLKLDMKFLSGDGDRAKEQVIIAAIIRMAHALSLPIIAEGVETREQAAMLLSLGCHQMQGYYFSRPIPAADYENLLFGRTALPPFAEGA